MLPFLLIQTRSDDTAAADELRSTAALGDFADGQLSALRLDRQLEPWVQDPDSADRPDQDWEQILDRHAGVILCGSPFTSSDPQETKSALQVAVEAELHRMLDVVVQREVPFLGACYGVGTLGQHQGAVVDTTYGESAGVVEVTTTAEGAVDPLLDGLDTRFLAFTGHKEAIRELPAGAVLLVTGEACPVQMFRVGEHLYATQFHPELDQAGLLFRLELYANNGYFDPAEQETLFATIRASRVDQPQKILRNFVRRYARQG